MLQPNIPPISTLSACHYICKTTKAILGQLIFLTYSSIFFHLKNPIFALYFVNFSPMFFHEGAGMPEFNVRILYSSRMTVFTYLFLDSRKNISVGF